MAPGYTGRLLPQMDDEHEPPKGFLRVERLLLGADIAAVHICERPRGRRPGSRGDRGCVRRRPR